jgi:DNA-binding SARP family transcriptional activator
LENRLNKLSVQLFGTLSVTDSSGRPVAIPGAKQQALLASLALNLERPLSRNKLINLLWGTRFDDQARQSLRQAVSKLRKSLNKGNQEALWSNADQIGLNPELVTIDTNEVERMSGQTDLESLNEASKLLCGTLLEGLHSNESQFDDWITTERIRFNGIACEVFDRLAEHHVRAGNTQTAIDTAKRLIALDPLREPSHRQLMRILAQCGQRAAAIRQYNTCADLLKSELDVEPEGETQRLFQEIRASRQRQQPTNKKKAIPIKRRTQTAHSLAYHQRQPNRPLPYYPLWHWLSRNRRTLSARPWPKT